jgi:PAS domain S-box-containing protein
MPPAATIARPSQFRSSKICAASARAEESRSTATTGAALESMAGSAHPPPRTRPLLEHLLALLLEQSRDHAVILMDPRGVILGWFAAAENIFGYTRQEMVGQHLDRLFTADDRARGVPFHELEVARANGHGEDDRWQLRKDGSRLWASGVVTPLRDAQGSLVGFGKVVRDRTDVKAQLDAAENRAMGLAAADRRKDLFLGTLAHELRSPLGSLLNAIELLRLAGMPAGDGVPLTIMERQVATLERLVEDLLDVSRIGAGKVRLDLGPLRLEEVLRLAAETVRPSMAERAQRFEVLLLPTTVHVEADAARLQQVFVNLLANASKYTPEGGRIWLKETIEGEEAVVRVEDNGIGIGADVLPRIFDLFTQEESSRAMAEGGLGLGLPLVRELVTRHGGTVQVRSEGRGKGSEFTVRLPLRRTSVARTREAASG